MRLLALALTSLLACTGDDDVVDVDAGASSLDAGASALDAGASSRDASPLDTGPPCPFTGAWTLRLVDLARSGEDGIRGTNLDDHVTRDGDEGGCGWADTVDPVDGEVGVDANDRAAIVESATGIPFVFGEHFEEATISLALRDEAGTCVAVVDGERVTPTVTGSTVRAYFGPPPLRARDGDGTFAYPLDRARLKLTSDPFDAIVGVVVDLPEALRIARERSGGDTTFPPTTPSGDVSLERPEDCAGLSMTLLTEVAEP